MEQRRGRGDEGNRPFFHTVCRRGIYPLMVKKNPAFNKGSGIVTNGSFSSSNAEALEKAQTTPNGSLQARRTSSLKGSGTKMGTHSVQNGTVRMGILNSDTLGNPGNGRSMSWLPNGYVTLIKKRCYSV